MIHSTLFCELNFTLSKKKIIKRSSFVKGKIGISGGKRGLRERNLHSKEVEKKNQTRQFHFVTHRNKAHCSDFPKPSPFLALNCKFSSQIATFHLLIIIIIIIIIHSLLFVK
jgi:hypothetical protein